MKPSDLIGIARELGQTRFLPRAGALDREGAFPVENYADLAEAGFLGLTIAEAYGGLGADYATYARVSAELGRWCGATALTFNMHCASMLWPGLIADDLPMSTEQRAIHERRRRAMYAGVIEAHHVYAQPFSEPNSAAAAGKAPFGTTAERVEGGWRIEGRKHFASLAGYATHYSILCTELRENRHGSVRDTIYLTVPADAEGFHVEGEWDVLGMRATSSRSLRLEGVYVPRDNEMLPSGLYYEAALNWPHMFMTLCPTYVGIARAAVDFTRRYLRGEEPGAPPAGAGVESPVKQFNLAQMQIKLEQLEALFERAIGEAGYRPSKAQRLRAYACQYTVMEYCNEICRDAIRVCGGRSLAKRMRLEQLYRDSRCGSLMLPWTPDICLERIGRETLED